MWVEPYKQRPEPLTPIGNMNPNQNQAQAMDPQAVALAKSIRQAESGNNFNQTGKSGEIGAYQWMPDTWKTHAKNVLGDANAPLTPENQNAVAYVTIKQWKDQGLNPAQIAAKWNSGSEANWENKIGTNAKGVAYDVPAYVKKVTDFYQTFKPQDSSNPLGATPAYASDGSTPSPQPSGPAFPYQQGDSAVTAGLKAIGNTPGSLFGFVKNTAQTFNPLNAIQNLEQIGSGFGEMAGEHGYGKAFLDVLRNIPEGAYHTFVPEGVRNIVSGDVAGATKQFTNDPFGQAAPIVLAAEGGARALDRSVGTNLAPSVDSAISKVGGGAIDVASKAMAPVRAAADMGMGAASTLTRSLASHLTSLSPETITQVLADPSSFSKVAQDNISRGSIFEAVKSGLADLKSSYGESGQLYQQIKNSEGNVVIPENFFKDILERHGLKLTGGPEALANGEAISVNPKGVASLPGTGGYQIVADTNSITRNPAEIKALQNLVDNWAEKQDLTPREFLNFRKDIQGVAKFEKPIGTNKEAARVAADMYAEANKTMRPQIKTLKELDAAAAPQIEMIKRVSKDFLDKDGNFKDNAPSKIVNSLSKEGLLSRLESLRPGITKQLQVLKAVEDIERAQGIKVGAYTRGAIEGYGAVSGNIPAIAAAIITNPAIAVQLIRGLGWTKTQIIPLLHVLKAVAGDVATNANNMPSSVLAAGIANNNTNNK